MKALAWTLFVWQLLCLAAVPARPAGPPALVGVVENVVPHVDPRDARTALEIWISEMVSQAKLDLDGAVVTPITSLADAEARISAGQFDIIAMPATYYLKLKRCAGLEPIAITARGDTPGESYCLLVRRDSGIERLKNLKGRHLLVQSSLSEDNPAFLWLESLLAEEKLPAARQFFPSAQADGNPAKVLLPVFFRQAAACVTSLHAFRIMAELNPQIEEQLRILAQSPPLPETVICLGPHAEPRYKAAFREHVLNLRRLPRGRQILTLFQIDAIVPYRDEHLLPLGRLAR